MKKYSTQTHYLLETRLLIEEMLNAKNTITEISRKIGRDRSNIARDILKHRTLYFPTSFNGNSTCIHKMSCQNKHLNCYLDCKNYEMELCDKLKASPHVCNGCPTKSHCRKAKYYYNAKDANNQYKEKLITSRTGNNYNEQELNILNNDLYNMVINTKSLYHSLIVINRNGWNFSIKTIYRLIKKEELRLKSKDLPRSNRKRTVEEKDKTYKRDITGHTYEDYEKYKEEKPKSIEWQMDCVQGIQGKGEPVLLTLQIVEIKFLLAFRIEYHKAKDVIDKLTELKSLISLDKLVDILLTDNGHEFLKLDELITLLPESKIFYCHPYSSYEKGSIENNHELLRRIIPQGVSLKPYTQDDINIIINHINSLYREELDGKCPFDLIDKYFEKNTINKLNLKKVSETNVMLIPELLGDKNIYNIKKYLSKEEIKKANITFKNNNQ